MIFLFLIFSLSLPAIAHRRAGTSRITARRDPFAHVKPVLKHRMYIFYIHAIDARFKSASGVRLHAKGTISKKQVRYTRIHYQGLARYIARQTRGKVRLVFKTQYLRAVIRDIDVSQVNFGPRASKLECRSPVLETMTTPDGRPFPIGRILLEKLKEYDTFAFYWPNGGQATVATGGGRTYPIVPYQLYSTIRGHIFYPASWRYATIFLHEFFHNIEGMYGISPVHGYMPHVRHHFPNWHGRHELDYYIWHFGTTLRRKGYHLLNWRFQYPDRISRAAYLANLAVSRRVPVVQRRRAHLLGRRAAKLWYKKQKTTAVRLAGQAKRFNPWNAEALQVLALDAGEHKQWRTAAVHFEQLRQLRPAYWSINYLGAIYLWHLKQPERALAVFKSLVSLKLAKTPGEQGDVFNNLGRSLRRLKRYPEARRAFARAVHFYTNRRKHADPLWGSGDCLLAENRRDPRYIRVWKQAATLRRDAWRWRSIGYHEYTRFHRYRSALNSYRRSLALEKNRKDRADTLWHIGVINKRLKRYRPAIRYFKRAATTRRKRSFRASCLWETGNCYAKMQKKSLQAIRWWRQSVDLEPVAWRWRHIAWYYQSKLGHVKAAVTALQQAIRLYSKSADRAGSYWQLAWLYRKQYAWNNAIRAFRFAANLYRKPARRADCLRWTGHTICRRDKSWRRGIPWLIRAARVQPAAGRWTEAAWYSYRSLKQYTPAVRYYRKALVLARKNKTRADILLNLGRIALYTKQPRKGLGLFRRALVFARKKKMRGNILWETGNAWGQLNRKSSQRLSYWTRAARLDPGKWRWWYIGNLHHWTIRNLPEAVFAYKNNLRYLKAARDKAIVWIAIGRAEMDSGRFAAANRAYDNAWRLYPRGKRGGEALFWKGYLYGFKFKRKAAAAALVRRAIRLGYNSNLSRRTLRKFSR